MRERGRSEGEEEEEDKAVKAIVGERVRKGGCEIIRKSRRRRRKGEETVESESEAGRRLLMTRNDVVKQREETEGWRWRCEFDRRGESREKMAHSGSDGEMESVRKQQQQHLH